jgi:hypothetical protein
MAFINYPSSLNVYVGDQFDILKRRQSKVAGKQGVFSFLCEADPARAGTRRIAGPWIASLMSR